MSPLILLLFGLLSTVHGIYKIPEHDPCVLRVLLCDDFTKPLTPVDNSTLEMFETIGELNAVCDELSKFRICLKNAEKFCKEHSELDVGFQLLNNRRLAFDMCVRASPHQQVYMMVEGCVNKYSHSAIEFCTDKAVEKVGLEFDLGDYDAECRFLGEIQHCHIAVVTDQCGSIAGNLLEKLVVFRGERDFMCIGYERKRLSNIESFYATMESYVEQYRNIVYRLETEEKSERVDASKKFKTQDGFGKGQVSSYFQSRISPVTDKVSAFGNIYGSDRERPLNSEKFHRTEKLPLYSFSNQEKDSTSTPPKTDQGLRRFYEKQAGKVLSYENFVCKTKASFLLTGIRRNGKPYHLGWGVADVLWATSSPLKDISCAWMGNPAAPQTLARCSILISHSMLVGESCQRKGGNDLPLNTTLAVYETVNDKEAKRVAELRVLNIVKYSSTSEINLKSFKKHAHDIRYWCSEHHEVNKYKESNWVQCTSRIGLMPSYDNKNGILDEESRVYDEKYNFYESENAKYPIDTEFHLISSEDRKLENEFNLEDTYTSPNYDENLNPLREEIANGKNLEPFTLQPSKLSKSLHHSYRPYELYRPRVGEVLEVKDQAMLNKHFEIEDAEKDMSSPKMLSIEDAIEDKYATHLNIQDICPVLQENNSELVNKLASYSKENYMNMADQLDMVVLESYTKFPIYKGENGFPFINKMRKDEEPENINTSNKYQYEEIYVVTPSTEIELHGGPCHMIYEDSEDLNVDEDHEAGSVVEDHEAGSVVEDHEAGSVVEDHEAGSVDEVPEAGSVDEVPEAGSVENNSQTFKTEDDREDLVKVPQESDSKDLTQGNDFITKSTNSRNSKSQFLELISNYQNKKHPFFVQFFDASTNHEVASEELSAISEKLFSRRSNQKYPTDMEEIFFNAFEILAELKINVRRIRKVLKERRRGETIKTMIKTEL